MHLNEHRSPKTVFLLRHGEIDTGSEKRFVGQTDLPLTDKGRWQARYWHETFKHNRFDRIYCSDLSRTIETAKIIAEPEPDSVEPTPQLREIYMGTWQGVPMQDIRDRFPEQWEARGRHPAAFRAEGGENFFDVSNRAIPFFKYVLDQPERNVLMVAHAGVIRVILCHVLGMNLDDLFNIGQDYAGLNIIEKKSHRVQIKALNINPEMMKLYSHSL